MAMAYQETKLASEDVTVLQEIENMIGEPIPKIKQSINLKFGFVVKNKRLIALGLVGKKLTSLPASIGDCDQLEDLFLSNNRLKTFPESFTKLKNLKKLDLWNNSLTKESFNEKFCFLVNLHYLELRKNEIEDAKTFGDYYENSFKTKNNVKTFLNQFRK